MNKGSRKLWLHVFALTAMHGAGNAAYVAGDPLSHIDPEGLDLVVVTGGSPSQDAAAAAFFASRPGMNSVGYLDNCAVRTNQGLAAAGLPVSGIPFPGGVARNATVLPGAQSFYIPKHGSLPESVIRQLPVFKKKLP